MKRQTLFTGLLVMALVSASGARKADAQDCTNPDGALGVVRYNIDHAVFQGCTDSGWVAFHDPCTGDPSPGRICADGTIYAGTSPDGNVPMYMTPADAGQITWNNGTTNWIDTAMSNTSYTTGEANTALLVGLSDAASPYEAALYCHCLGKPATGSCSSDPTGGASGHGHDDWYLPARNELDALYDNLVDQDGDTTPGGPLGDPAALFGFNVTGAWPAGYYWSSSESGYYNARSQRFSDGSQHFNGKSNGLSVRCVRR